MDNNHRTSAKFRSELKGSVPHDRLLDALGANGNNANELCEDDNVHYSRQIIPAVEFWQRALMDVRNLVVTLFYVSKSKEHCSMEFTGLSLGLRSALQLEIKALSN